MDLPPISAVTTDAAHRALLDDLDRLRQEIDKVRPLDDATVRRLRNEVLGDQVHESAAIEGNSLTLRETLGILSSGQVVDVGRKRDHLEVLNLGKAIESIQSSILGAPRWRDESFLLGIHRILFEELHDDTAGAYRTVRVVLTGAKHQPPRDVAPLMQQFFAQLAGAAAAHPVIAATWVHWALARIHPFNDGNGRMARLWQDYVLLAHQYVPAVIPAGRRKIYYAALEAADDGCFAELLQLVAQSAITTAQVYVNAIREADAALGWATALVAESDQRADEHHRLAYSRWQSRIVELRDAFQRCVTLLNRKSGQMEFELVAYPLIDQTTWEGLRSEPHASGNWLFRLVARSAAGRFQHVFFAGKHFRTNLDDQLQLRGPQVNVIVSEKHGPAESFILAADNSPVTLREVLVVNNEFIRKRWDPTRREERYDENVSALTIAQDFLSEVVRHLLKP